MTLCFSRRAGLMRMVACNLAVIAAVWAGPLHALDRPTDTKLIAAAKADGSLAVYSASSAAALQADAQAFQKAYGIQVTFTQMTSGPMGARIDQELRSGRINADLIISADTSNLYRWAADQAFAKLPEVKFPDRADFLAPIQSIYQSIFYNTSLVPAANVPKTWNDVLDPRFTGKIVLGSPRIGTAYFLQYWALWKDPQYGEEFFRKLAAQRPRVVQTPALVAQLVASGEGAIGFNGIPYDAANLRRLNPGAPINYTYLNPVTTARTYVAINAKANKPNAARLFAAWLMSPEGQAIHNGEGRASSLLGNLPGTLSAPDPSRVRFDITVNKAINDYQTIIQMFDRLYK